LPVLDAATVEAAVASASGEVIGFYRTTPVCGVPMRDEDKALAASSFRNPASVFLLVEAGKSGIGEARFCFWGEGELFDWPLMLFPFDAEELAVEEMRRRSSKNSPGSHTGLTPVAAPGDTKTGTPGDVGAVATGPAHQSAAATAGQSNAAVSKPPREGRRRWLVPVLAAIVVVLLLAGGFLNFIYFKRVVNLPAVPPAEAARGEVKVPLGLAVERRGNDLRISWNSSAPLIAKADFGMLLIRGSAVSRDVPLTAEELRAGSVMYSSLADQVRFQLNVVAGEQVAREFLTVLMPVASDGRPAPVITRSGTPIAPASQVSGAPASVRELRQFKPVENQSPATAASHRIEEPPTVAGTPAVASAPPSVLTQTPGLSRPPVATPAPVNAPAPIDFTAQNPSPAEVPVSASQAHPPVATRQILPSLPPLLRGVFWKATVVEVNVSVDAAGNVVKAEAAAKPGLHPLLRDAAVDAARRWKFKPAQFDGHSVPANMVLQFNFAASR
jgi:TonB family protein